MAGGNLSPRQKMINMMYLVLTALLAMNVSKEILDSFVTVNNGLETTKGTLQGQMDKTYASFSKNATENKAKYGDAYAKAKVIQDMANVLIKHIDSLKVKVIHESEKLPVDKIIALDASAGRDTVINMMYLHNKDAYNEITNLMIGGEPATPKDGPWSATELRTMLEAYRDKLKTMESAPAFHANIDALFDFSDRLDASFTLNNWQSINFYHVPVAAGVTILSKIQSDIRNGENELINKLFADVEGSSFKFSELSSMVDPLSSYVTVGNKYQADIFLGAYDPNNKFSVELATNGTIDTVKNEVIGPKEVFQSGPDGKYKLEIPASSAGEKKYAGIIVFKPVGQPEQRIPFMEKFEVAAPSLVVSPTKMNVFYRGVDNPVSISVAGFSASQIQPSMSNGTLSKDKEGFIVKPGKEAKAMVSVTVTNPDGTKKSMPGVEFRVKNVPNPTPYFAGKSANDETVKKSELTAAQGVIAKMENFEFDLKFEVVEYRVTMIVAGTPIEKVTKGAALSGDMKEMLTKAKPGQKVYIEGIKARGPDGTVRNLGGLSFKVT
ncbi:MAG: gliding motility protein GldM [Flavobacteriales bacterium]|nr:gliding motility protein GldM [Flavobacteriales bacterium]